MVRISLDEEMILIAQVVAERSTCLRGNVGALIVQDRRIVATGYNGALPGQPHCTDVGCDGGVNNPGATFENGEWPTEFPHGCTRAMHAETNAVAFAARHGISCDGGTLYCTHATCLNCARTLVAAGIIEVMYLNPYRLTEGIELLDQCNIKVRQYV